MSDTKAASVLQLTAERLEKMATRYSPIDEVDVGQFHDQQLKFAAQACRLVQRLAEMGPIIHHPSDWCVFCEAADPKAVEHKPDCIWLLARQLYEKTE